MIRKLPFWIWGGGALLAFAAGIMNVIGLMGIRHKGVSHLTATITQIGTTVGGERLSEAVTLGLLISLVLAFTAGAAVSGLLIRETALQLGRRYGLALLLETVLILAAAVLLDHGRGSGVLLLCAACGLQNGLVTAFSGAVVRTTHMTGIITDLGIALGHVLRGDKTPWRRVTLLSCLLGGFLLGGVFGGMFHYRLGDRLLYVPATITWSLALAYAIFARWTRTHRCGSPVDVAEEVPAEAGTI